MSLASLSKSLCLDYNENATIGKTYSFRVGHQELNNASVTEEELSESGLEHKLLDAGRCTLDDLTEDCGESQFVSYGINSMILLGEEEQENPYGSYLCHMNNETKEFFIEIQNEENVKAFTQTTFMFVLEKAEQALAKVVYVCFSEELPNKSNIILCKELLNVVLDAYCKSLLFVGFSALTEEERNKLNMAKNLMILKYSLESDENDFF